MTNYERIKSMDKRELAKFIDSLVNGKNEHDVGCYGCIDYGTHHSDPNDKNYSCNGCYSEGIGHDVMKYLDQKAQGDFYAD